MSKAGLVCRLLMHAYHATRHSTARMALFTAAQGQQTWAEVVCDTPMACHRGDRLVLRDQALDATLGGGEVLFVSETQVNRRNTVAHRELVAAYAASDAAESFRTLMLQLQLRNSQMRFHMILFFFQLDY